MINKPNAIRWLENETGQTIHYPTDQTPGQDRHLSVRLPAALAASLDSLAAERNLKLSQLVRELLTDATTQHQTIAALDSHALADRLAADVAEVRRRLAG